MISREEVNNKQINELIEIKTRENLSLTKTVTDVVYEEVYVMNNTVIDEECNEEKNFNVIKDFIYEDNQNNKNIFGKIINYATSSNVTIKDRLEYIPENG